MSKFGAVFLVLMLVVSVNAAARAPDRAGHAESSVARNERLTAVNGALLFAVIVGIAATVLLIRPLLSFHYMVGFALIPPLALKLYSTGYKFAKYYLHDRSFRQAGPPPAFLRFAVAPMLVASTVAVMGSGIELWAFGARFGTWWLGAHTVSAVLFMAALFAHLLSHLRRSADAAGEDALHPADGAVTRRSVILACAILAVVLAVASLGYSSPFGYRSGGA